MVDPATLILVGAGLAGLVGMVVLGRFMGEGEERLSLSTSRPPPQGDPHPHLSAARAAGLGDVVSGIASVEGSAGELRVRLEHLTAVSARTRVTVSGLPPTLALRREDSGTLARKALGAREVTLGDEDFDRELFVEGPSALLRALFDPETRLLTRHVFQGRDGQGQHWAVARSLPPEVRLEKGALTVVVAHAAVYQMAQALADILRVLLELARRLEAPAEVAPRLLANVRADPLPSVRLLSLTALTREFPGHVSTREALQAAVTDASPDVRLEAAIALGDEGLATLLGLADQASIEDALAARALDALGPRLPAERGRAIVESALRSGRLRSAAAALRALGVAGDPTVEPVLLGVLQRAAPEEVRVAAANGLGRAGSAAAVPILRDVDQDDREHRALRRAAREAIAAIQGRLTNASPGRLALAAPDAGQLSIPEDVAGRVALEPTREPDA